MKPGFSTTFHTLTNQSKRISKQSYRSGSDDFV